MADTPNPNQANGPRGATPSPAGAPQYQAAPQYRGAPQYQAASTAPGAGSRGPQGNAGAAGAVDIRRYVAIVFGHWWLILLFLILGAAAGATYCYTATPLYRASCRIEVMQDPRLQFNQSGGGGFQLLNQELSRLNIVLQSRLLRQQVNMALTDTWGDDIPDEYQSPAITVSPVRQAETMLDISVDAVSQPYALAYLTQLLEEYREKRRGDMLTATENAVRSLRGEMDKVGDELEEAQNELATFQQTHSIQLSETKSEWDERFLASLIQRQNALRMERTMLETQFDVLESASAGTIQDALNLTLETHEATLGQMLLSSGAATESLPTPVRREQGNWQNQELLLARLKAQYEDMLETYRPEHPRMVTLKRQISDVERDLALTAEIALTRLRERHRAVGLQHEALDKAVRTWRAELNLTAAERANYQTLRARVDYLDRLHNQVYTRLLDGTVMEIDPISQRTVEQPSSRGMIWPNKTKIMALSIMSALLAAVGLAFLLEHLDTGMLDLAMIEEQLGVPYLSGIPHWGRVLKGFKATGERVVVSRRKTNVATEVYRTVRSSIEHAMGPIGEEGYALLVTSNDAGDGKSLTALNLAIVFAWTGRKVLLIDGDLRRGTLGESIGITKEKGFADLLSGHTAEWRDIVVSTQYEDLSFIPAGEFHQEAPELLNSSRMKQLLNEWRQQYDLVVFDSAPVGRVVDSAVLARLCSGVILVALFGKTRFADLRHSLHRLEGTNIIGFCLNAVDLHKASKGYAYRRYYGYGNYGYYGYYGYGYYGYGGTYPERPTRSEKPQKPE